MTEPTQEYIKNLKTHLEQVWSGTHARWREIDTYLQGTFSLWPTGVSRPSYHPSTAYARLDQAVNHQMPTKLTVKRFPKNDTYEEKKRADKIEKFLVELMTEVARKEPSHTVGQVKRHLLAYGYAVLEGPLLDSKDYQQMLRDEEGKRHWNPIRLRAPHPQRVLMSPSERDPGEAIKEVRRSSDQLKTLLERKRATKAAVVYKRWDAAKDSFQEFDTTEYWSDEWHTVMVEDEILYMEPNEWGYLPFIQGFSGWGMEPTDMREINPKYMAESLLEHVLETFKLEAQRKTAQHNAVIEAGFLRQGYDPHEGGQKSEEQAAEMLARDALLTGKQAAWWYKDTPQLPDWLFRVGEEHDSDIEGGTFSRSVGGQRMPGVTTVGQQAILTTQGERKFDAPTLQIDEMFSIACSNALRLIDALSVPIMVRGVRVGPKDIDGDYAVDASFKHDDPVMRAQERSIGMQEVEKGLIDPETYLADTGRENGQEITRKALVNKMAQTPQIMGTIIELAASEFKLKQRQSGNGLVGPNGQPIQSPQPQAMQMPVVANPAVEAMQNEPGGLGEQQVLNGQINGLTDAFAQ